MSDWRLEKTAFDFEDTFGKRGEEGDQEWGHVQAPGHMRDWTGNMEAKRDRWMDRIPFTVDGAGKVWLGHFGGMHNEISEPFDQRPEMQVKPAMSMVRGAIYPRGRQWMCVIYTNTGTRMRTTWDDGIINPRGHDAETGEIGPEPTGEVLGVDPEGIKRMVEQKFGHPLALAPDTGEYASSGWGFDNYSKTKFDFESVRVAATDSGDRWAYLDGHVGFGQHHHQIIEQMAEAAGLNDFERRQVANHAMVNRIPANLPHQVAWGHMEKGHPAFWRSNIDRNHVWDAVHKAHDAINTSYLQDKRPEFNPPKVFPVNDPRWDDGNGIGAGTDGGMQTGEHDQPWLTVSKETHPQAKRRMEKIDQEHGPFQGIPEWQSPTGHVVYRLPSRDEVKREGKRMRNCWQGGRGVLHDDPEKERYMSMRDPEGNSVADWYEKDYNDDPILSGRGMVDVFAARNNRLHVGTPEHRALEAYMHENGIPQRGTIFHGGLDAPEFKYGPGDTFRHRETGEERIVGASYWPQGRAMVNGHPSYEMWDSGDESQWGRPGHRQFSNKPIVEDSPWEHIGKQELPHDLVMGAMGNDWETPVPNEPIRGTVGEPRAAAAKGQSWWHLTENPKFALDPNRHPENNTTMGGEWPEPGLMVSADPDGWRNGYDYVRPYVAEIAGEANNMGGYQGEHFIPASQFPQTQVKRVIPYSAWEDEHFEGKPYTGPDVRDFTPEQHQEHLQRANEYIRENRPHMLSHSCSHCGAEGEQWNECQSCGRKEDSQYDAYQQRGYMPKFREQGGDFYKLGAINDARLGELVQKAINEGGFSVNADLTDAPASGFYTAYAGGQEIPVEQFGAGDIAQVQAQLQPDDLIGAWFDRGIMYLDRSRRFDDSASALQFGADQGQLSVYDANTGETIPVPGSGWQADDGTGAPESPAEPHAASVRTSTFMVYPGDQDAIQRANDYHGVADPSRTWSGYQGAHRFMSDGQHLMIEPEEVNGGNHGGGHSSMTDAWAPINGFPRSPDYTPTTKQIMRGWLIPTRDGKGYGLSVHPMGLGDDAQAVEGARQLAEQHLGKPTHLKPYDNRLNTHEYAVQPGGGMIADAPSEPAGNFDFDDVRLEQPQAPQALTLRQRLEQRGAHAR